MKGEELEKEENRNEKKIVERKVNWRQNLKKSW